MTKRRVLVTGATGFVGEAVVFRMLLDRAYAPVAAVRGKTRLSGLCDVVPFDLSENVELPALVQVDVVVHCAARVHVMSDTAADPLAKFREINVHGTARLARKAAEAGVRRFVFLSSIKVNGEATLPGMPFKADDQPAPADPYGVSKCETEECLREIGRQTGMDIVIIRPPLVYGPGVKANFLSMMSWLNKGLPLPLGALRNQRSLVALGNLVDLVVTCIAHPAAANQTFLVSDGEDLSTSGLLRRMAAALGKPALLLPVPQLLLRGAARLMGRGEMAQRLFGSLQVDINKTCSLLQWSPPISVDRALKRTAIHYLER
ncbi:UDP-glucose 4-epimerase family protein [Pseudomonas parakoreensis]|uniref:UDP-glucose 4-epimerase family protein n=1 Tax=Pseudomonas parakoreensis TaxID=2892331 RepID=UPI00103DE14D|nr:SDR family oxidoreductase [Pseudomonas parakoreensis]